MGWLSGVFGSIFSIGAIAGSAITDGIVNIINLVIGVIAKVLVLLAVALIKWGIDINHTLVNGNGFAHYGWGITLGLSNLLIVIAVIVIAFGTMLRQSWGLKSLPRLVIVAILINFSYFIATQLLNIADGITIAFLNAANASVNWDTLASFFTTNINIDWTTLSPSAAAGIAAGTFATALSPLLAIAFTLLAFVSLIAVAVTFFVRYIAVTLLLILLPIALTTSLFSIKIGKGNAWEQWTSEFIKWLSFGPIMTFFIFLAFAVVNYPPPATPSFTAQMGSYIVVLGILIAGLTISNSMGITAAGTALAYANKGRDWAKSRAKSFGIRVASAPLRSEGGKKFTASLQTMPGLKTVGVALNKFGAAGEKLVDDSKFKDLSSDRLAQRVPALSGPDRIAALSKLAKGNDLGKVKNGLDYLTDENKTLFGSYGKGFGDVEKGFGLNIKAAKALKAKDYEALTTELKTFYGSFNKKDFSKLPVNDIYTKYDKEKPFMGLDEDGFNGLRHSFSQAIIDNPGNINSVAPNLKSKNFGNFITSVSSASGSSAGPLLSKIDTPSGVMTTSPEDVSRNRGTFANEKPELYKAIKKTLNMHETGVGFSEDADEEKNEPKPATSASKPSGDKK